MADGRASPEAQLRKVPPLRERWATQVARLEPRQGHRNDTALVEDDPLGGDVVQGFDETATPHQSKSKQPG